MENPFAQDNRNASPYIPSDRPSPMSETKAPGPQETSTKPMKMIKPGRSALVSSIFLIVYVSGMFVASYIVTVIVQKYGLLTRLIGNTALGARGWLAILLALYATTIYVGLNVAVVLSVVLGHGMPLNISDPRGHKASLGGVTSRLDKAQSNGVESMGILCLALIAAFMSGVAEGDMLECVLIFVLLRLAYIVWYALDLAFLRTGTHFAALACCLRLFFLALGW